MVEPNGIKKENRILTLTVTQGNHSKGTNKYIMYNLRKLLIILKIPIQK